MRNTPETIRRPQVAGAFYPADADACAAMVDDCLAKARPLAMLPKAVVAPHAGYVFSGPIAGTSFRVLANRKAEIRRVVVIGPAHRVGFKGLAVTSADAWASPLGVLPVDWTALSPLLALPGVRVMDDAFAQEHSLEVMLPFLQRALGPVSIVPILVGQAEHADVIRVIEAAWGGPETAFVVSSDLSHYLDYGAAKSLDAETAKMVELLQVEKLLGPNACGFRPLRAMLQVARNRDLRVTAVDLRSSGDTQSGRDRVVGYGAFTIEYGRAARLAPGLREQLLELARYVVRFGTEHGRPPKIGFADVAPALAAHRASFVSLKVGDRLRGCIGSVTAHRPFIEDVADSAYKAAFGDRRFQPLTAAELADLDFEIYMLGTPRPIPARSEAELLRALAPDTDGLVVQDQGKRAIYLPSVWGGIPEPVRFLRTLKVKAGLPADHWSDGFRAFRFSAEWFGAKAAKAAASD